VEGTAERWSKSYLAGFLLAEVACEGRVNERGTGCVSGRFFRGGVRRVRGLFCRCSGREIRTDVVMSEPANVG
jgi:hypothetical protein